MDKFSKIFFSMRMMSMGMIVFLLAIAAATFIESAYDIQTAKILIYNALWFELLLVYLGLILIANIYKYEMYRREKIASLAFHLSFLVILVGAGVTRYASFEGLMLIREGEKSDFIFSSDPHFWFRINDGKMQYTYDKKMYMSEQTSNNFDVDVDFPGRKSPITIEYVDFRKKLIDTLIVNDSISGKVLDIVTDGMNSNYVAKNGFVMLGDVAISFDKKNAMPGIHLTDVNGKIMLQSKLPLKYLPMSEMQKARQSGGSVSDSLFKNIPIDSLVPFQTTTLYVAGEQQFVFKQIINHAKQTKLPSGKKNVGSDFLTVRVSDGDKSELVELRGGMAAIPDHVVFDLNGLTYEMEYGSTRIPLPFSIACRDFQLDRYPGSNSPSSFASEVSIVDEELDYTRDQRIFMNNVMDYRGYRFFQSAYDPDEKGTRLSVNHDMWGTNITYLGYLLMAIGMILSLFAPNGRFKELNGKLKKSRMRREALMVFVLLFTLSFSGSAIAQDDHKGHNHEMHAGHEHSEHEDHTQAGVSRQVIKEKPIHRVISKEHADKLSSLLVQDYDGRIAPFHSVCDQLLRKIYRSNTYEGNNAIQTMMSMHMYPDYWMQQPVIYVSSNLLEPFGLKDNYASYLELSRSNGDFKWLKEYNESHRKMESKRDEFDKRLIKLVEKFQVVQAIFNWQYMKIIPVKKAENNMWYVPLDMELLKLDSVSSSMALRYLSSLDNAAKTGLYGEAKHQLEGLKAFQRDAGLAVVPSVRKVNVEISYNKMNIFKHAWQSYFAFGMLLLIMFFIRIFVKPVDSREKLFKLLSKIFGALLIVTFVYHGVGLGFRWYITGFAPWSNGYGAVVFIAWVTMIAGFAFARKNPVIMAGTAILAAMMIMVTEMNLMDPDITPLQPVLKSYWLMIHVSIITGSYGFLGLAAILGLLNLVLYIFRTVKNGVLFTLHIKELSYVSEMTMTIGLFMLTIGTFLGGIWANESWGRYWGWDPKETWALVSVLVYAVILHLRYIPALKSKLVFNVVSLWGYSAILFTFFGVNFYLVGLHSYAQGEGLGTVPTGVILTIIGFTIFTLVAIVRARKYARLMENELEN
jgi:cytochrome c-type biogenesis protein CcsB